MMGLAGRRPWTVGGGRTETLSSWCISGCANQSQLWPIPHMAAMANACCFESRFTSYQSSALSQSSGQAVVRTSSSQHAFPGSTSWLALPACPCWLCHAFAQLSQIESQRLSPLKVALPASCPPNPPLPSILLALHYCTSMCAVGSTHSSLLNPALHSAVCTVVPQLLVHSIQQQAGGGAAVAQGPAPEGGHLGGQHARLARHHPWVDLPGGGGQQRSGLRSSEARHSESRALAAYAI